MNAFMNRIIGLWLIACTLVLAGCSDSDKEVPKKPETPTQQPQKPTTPTENAQNEMNKTIDDYLTEYYLWNDEYKGMTRDLSIPYVDSYDNFMETTLLKMKGNTLDKKKTSSGNYSLYSYIDRKDKKPRSKAASGVTHGIEKEDKIKSFGFSKLAIVNFVNKDGTPTGTYGFVVESVYPKSVAETFGVKRGSFIYTINGETITDKNYKDHYLELVQPTKNNVMLEVGDGTKEPDEMSLTATEIEATPIMKNEVLQVGGHKIGYLIYDAFEAGYDNDLLVVLSEFKKAGITDLVLDLRYNGGGHVISSMMLSGCLAGSDCKGKIFQYYRYNDTRMKAINETMKQTGNNYDPSAGYFYDHYMYDNYFGVNLAAYDLSHANLYVLTTGNTASSSEILVSSLRGIGVPVTLIGEKTNGKNVGMEVEEFDKGNYSYELAPITFQNYNARKETVPATGLSVDYPVADWNDGYVDFGKDEPMLAKALELITGTTAKATARSTSTVKVKQVPVDLPVVGKQRLQGAIIFNQE